MKLERDDEDRIIKMRFSGTPEEFENLESALVEGRRTQQQKDLLTGWAIQMREVRTGTPEDERPVSEQMRLGPKPRNTDDGTA